MFGERTETKCAYCGMPLTIPADYNLDYIQCSICGNICEIERGLG